MVFQRAHQSLSGSTIAHFFLVEMETHFLQQLLDCPSKVYFRYVTISNNDESSMEFVDALNSQHKNLQFIIKMSTSTLSFLDMELKIDNNNLQLWI